jgi:hypothetical protein
MASSTRNIVIVVVIILAIGGVAYVRLSSTEREASPNEAAQQEETPPETEAEEHPPTEEEQTQEEQEPESEPEPEPEPEPTATEWVPEDEWWTLRQVPMYSNIATVMVTGAPYPTGAHTEEYYLDVMGRTGVTVASWFDYMWKPINNDDYQEYIDAMHAEGVYVVGTESMITTWKMGEEPQEYVEAIALDPYGNKVSSGYGLSPMGGTEEWYVHTLLHPAWQEYLLDSIKRSIDYGVDGYLIDELCYGAVLETDFSENTLGMFREYLYETLTEAEKTQYMNQFGYSSWGEFDYAEVVRDALPGSWTSLSREDWSDWELQQGIPLFTQYQRFVRIKNREAAQHIIEEAKQYAEQVRGESIPFSSNVNDLTSPESYLVMDLIDFVDLECGYDKFMGYYPRTRMIAPIKLAQSMGKRPYVLTNLETRSQVSEKGAEGTRNFYKLAIAEAAASGGNFYMEEGEHGVSLDVDELAPYYLMPSTYAEVFDVETAENSVCLLSLWENLEAYQNKAYYGTCSLLTDAGYQYDVVFGAEDYTTWGEENRYPAPDYPLTLEQINGYELVIIPELSDITDKHAEILLEYTEAGGRVLAFTTPLNLDTLENHRGADTNVNRLLGYMNQGEASVGAGQIITVDQVKGTYYIDAPGEPTLNDFINMVTRTGHEPEITGMTGTAVGKTMYSSSEEAVIHLVNYQYNWMQDKVKPPTTYTLGITLPDTLDGIYTVTYLTPETEPTELEYTVNDGTVTVTVPGLDVWGIIRVTTG